MPKYNVIPNDTESFFDEDEIIVSKTDLKGIVIYANDVFLKIAEFDESEVIGQQHSLIRHPDMPRAVFKLLWDTLQSGKEIFAYVKNMTKSGAYYWVLAHVTPTFGENDEIISYHSSRRVPDREAINKIEPLYAQLLAEEQRHNNSKEGMENAVQMLLSILEEADVTYDEFILSL